LVELTAAQLQLARTDRAMGETGAPAVEAVRAALYTAEESRRPEAVRRAELELRQVSLADYYARLHERARGRGADADPTSLITGVRVSGTILFLDLKNSSLFGRDHDPATVMLTINQMMAHISHALRRHEGRINQFLGDGFLARFLGDDHARQAVEAGLEMNEAMKEFNEPRDLLRLPPFEVRIGINTGELCLGNVGTYEKMEFASLGSTTNFAARLQSLAEPGRPCIGRSTRDAVGDRYAYAKPEGKDEEAKGFGVVRFWEVTGRKG
jgi:class 3 adenylate cyclase